MVLTARNMFENRFLLVVFYYMERSAKMLLKNDYESDQFTGLFARTLGLVLH